MGYWRESGRRMVKHVWELRQQQVVAGTGRRRWMTSSSNRGKAQAPPPPDPIPSRPLRGRRRPTPPPPPSSSGATSLVSDEAFLDKFKLGPPPPTDQGGKQEEGATEVGVKKEGEEGAPDADRIFREMKEKGLIPNAVAMLDGLCKDGLVQEAMKLFNAMREKGTFPDVVVYTAVVEGFCRARKPHDAIRVFRKMQHNGIPPNAFSYGVLIRGLSASPDHLDDAVDFCLDMLQAGHSPNLPTFVALVDALCQARGVDHAHSVVSTLCQRGFLLNHKAVSDFLDKNAPTSSSLPEAIFGKRPPRRLF